MKTYNTKYLFFLFVSAYCVQEVIFAQEYHDYRNDFERTYEVPQKNGSFEKLAYRIDEESEFKEHFLSNIFDNVSLENVNKQCKESLIMYFNDLMSLKPWAIEMFDATGKPSSGILLATELNVGSFEDCLRISVQPNDGGRSFHFKGQYCMLHLQHPLFQPPLIKTEHGRNYAEAFGTPPEWAREFLYEHVSTRFGLYLGICIPSICTKEDIFNIITAFDEPATLNVTLTDCAVEEEIKLSKNWPLSAKIGILVLSIFLLLNVVGTLIDLKDSRLSETNSQTRNGGQEVLKSFSVHRNLKKLFTVNPKKSPTDILHGFKFLFCFWTTMGHFVIYPTLWKEVSYKHMKYSHEVFSPWWLLPWLNTGLIVVEGFFFISGFLLTYLLWPELEKTKGKLNIWGIFLIRLLRLTPVHLFIIIVSFALPLISSGPLWNSEWGHIIENCINNGWKNILYINNYDDSFDICWMHTWYMSITMQYTIVSLPLMIFIYKYPKCGIFGCLIIMLGCMIHDYYRCIELNFSFFAFNTIKVHSKAFEYVSEIYIRPTIHFSTNLIGMLAGWIILKYKMPNLNKVWVITGWFLCALFHIISFYSPVLLPNIQRLGAFYNTTRNALYSGALSWIIFASSNGYGGVIEKVLTWKFLVPLSRISFSLYIVHPLLIGLRDASITERIYADKLSPTIEVVPYTLLSFLLGLIVYVMVEAPCNNLISLLMKKKTTVEQKPSPSLHETTNENK